jgi:hypothetical protein
MAPFPGKPGLDTPEAEAEFERALKKVAKAKSKGEPNAG